MAVLIGCHEEDGPQMSALAGPSLMPPFPRSPLEARVELVIGQEQTDNMPGIPW